MRVLAPLLDSLRRCLEGFPDKRRGTNSTYRMVDFGMAAFSAFFMQSPSFLDFQRRLENEHARSLPDPVRYTQDSDRQPNPGHARSGGAGAASSGLCRID